MEIVVPVFHERAWRGRERIEATELAPGAYKLSVSPGFVEGIAAGDTIRLTEAEPGFEVLSRSGNVCVWLYLDAAVHSDHGLVGLVKERVAPIGGWVDGGHKQMVVVTVPLASGFNRIGSAMDSIVEVLGTASGSLGTFTT